MEKPVNNKDFFYPPGGILIWIIIIVEVLTFGAGIIVFAWEGSLTPDIFEVSRKVLHSKIGFANTLILLTSGFFVAEAVYNLKMDNSSKSQRLMWLAMLLGVLFLVLKGIEYSHTLEQGYGLTTNTFFTFYWLLTGFHFLHVLTGLVILSMLTLKIRQSFYHKNKFLDVETGAAFWHMCDIIWLLLFPVLYLL
jgi:nitric oxide reductase NorE protein